MAFNQEDAYAEQVAMVEVVTGCNDRSMISAALKGNHGSVDTVVNEILDDLDKFRRKYGWDEAAFSSGREGEDSSKSNVPAFAIHQPPPVIYGTEPNNYYGAPSRPPSRANNRSPMSRLADMAAGEYTTATPSNRQEEEDQLQRAINESLTASGIQTPHAFPPPPPPAQQQSGVITNDGESSAHFGPAKRPDYDPKEWAMVPLGKQESDSDPSLRARTDRMPVLLRCRKDSEWEKHRVGALLMIFGQIPAVRNVLVESGVAPGYGYGNKSDWWRGEAISPPGQPDPDGWINEPPLSWSDEVHRLMAFLELTERAYGTADSLIRARHPDAQETGDAEKDFFQNFAESGPAEGTHGNRETLISSVEIVSLENFSQQGGDRFGLLDLQVSKDSDPMPANLYNVLDWLFFVDLRLAREDPSGSRMAWISQPSEVFTCRFQRDDELPAPLEMPETFYLDRYLKSNGEKLRELQMDMVALLKTYDANFRKEQELTKWVNPRTNKTYDRRDLIKATVHRYQEHMRKIKHRAFWREHEQTPAEGEGGYYLPDHAGEPSLLPEESATITYYEAKIRELEDRLAEIKRLIDEVIMPEREAIHEVNRKMSSLFTVPSADEKWNPTHKYTLCGVVNDLNTVYQRIHVPVSEPGATPADDAPAPAVGEKRWWKTSFNTADNTVEHAQVTYETVMRETCSAKCKPIVVYATDKALEQDNTPLSDALKTFVRLDNRLFKQELLQSNRLGHKRSAGVGDGSQSKRLQRSASIDSMDTNHASAGDFDDDMRDAPFDNDEIFGVAGGGYATPNRATRATQDAAIPDLVDVGGETPGLTARMTSPPSYENYIEMETGVSPALAQVSLQDLNNTSPLKALEMQERPNAQLLTRPGGNGNNNGGAATNGSLDSGSVQTAVRDEEEPLIDLSDPKDADPKTQANGV
ncbi:hypothetical protein B0I37DRAFT_120295 [Chaetomium sp. MPI-CAGE-AT-0009]|nr:hypothetical protein B0I37DRAFT_120295 [Chaetomium sp. MPI-CAGE-AT-0009]